MKLLLAFAVLLTGALGATGESFRLKLDKTGKEFGPFEYEDGAKLTIGKATFTLVRSSVSKDTADSDDAYIPKQLTLEVLKTACPNLSKKAIRAFDEIVAARNYTKEEAYALMWDLYAQGETLLSERETVEFAAFFWQAVETLSPQEQLFITQANMKISAGEGFSYADQERLNTLTAKAFTNLPEEDHMRFLDIRCKSLSLALLNPEKAKANFEASYPPTRVTATSGMTSAEKQSRIEELSLKGIQGFSVTEQKRFMLLQMKQLNEMTSAEYQERLEMTQRMMAALTEEELKEFMAIAMEYMSEQ